jgi:DUF438 domain-containing protein
MNQPEWIKEFPSAINICDKEGILLYLNDKSLKFFEKYGGEKLIGTNIIECHTGDSLEKFKDMLKNPYTNCYISVKNGNNRVIYQAPWYKDGEYMGIVEMILDVPPEMPFTKVEE